MGLVPAPQTGEVGLRTTVLFIDIAAAVACPTGVPWIDKDQGDTSPLGFVDQKVSQLPKAPIGPAGA